MDYQSIKLLGGAEVFVDFDARMASCKKCGEKIRFGITKNGRSMPICEIGGNWRSHFSNCKFANNFRKKGKLEERIAAENKNREFLNNV